MTAGSPFSAALGRAKSEVARRLRSEAGFTLIEVVLAAMMLAIISAPISAIISQSAVIAKIARERTGADQIAQTQIESIRALDYYSVGIVNGNPPGSLTAQTQNVLLPNGTAVTINRTVTYVADPIPTAYVTSADYKKVTVTVTRNSDNKVLSTKVTYVSSASAPPYGGTTWVMIKRQVIDAVTTLPLAGVSVNLTGGPKSENRTDKTDGSGTVVFPALTSSATSLPVFLLATTLTGYNVFPDDLSPATPVVDRLDAGSQLGRNDPDVSPDLADGERPDVGRIGLTPAERPSRSTRRGAACRHWSSRPARAGT